MFSQLKTFIAVTLVAVFPLAATEPYTHVYQGDSLICFLGDKQDALTVTIDTPHLHLRSLQGFEEQYASYFFLFSDPVVMQKYASGHTKSQEETWTLVNKWAKRWRERDPYSALAIYKNDTGEFIGHILIGHGDEPGQSELAFLLRKEQWGKGFGTEAAGAVVLEYAPATVKEGYTLEGAPLNRITATARPDNIASVKILEKIGMHRIGEEEKFGALRYQYSIDLGDVLKKMSIEDPRR